MNTRDIQPFAGPRVATIAIPGSKSYTNRALVMAALTERAVTLKHPLYCDDTQAMIACLRTLGMRIDTMPEHLTVHDHIGKVKNKAYELFAHDSGTTLRFLTALLCVTPGAQTIGGSARLNERPIQDLVKTLRLLGAQITQEKPPLHITSSQLAEGQTVIIDASVSSQFLSALLLISPVLNGVTFRLHGQLISRPYVEMTIQAMREWGVEVIFYDKEYCVPAGQRYHKTDVTIEGDFSSAGYFFAMAALTQSTITLRNLRHDSVQADRQFLTLLTQMGNTVHFSEEGPTLRGQGFRPGVFNMESCPDQVQTMAVLAAFAPGVTTITGVRSLRVKETERVLALKTELAKMGIRTEDSHDTLTIHGGNPCAATIDTYGDHRMAMAFAVAGTKLAGMRIQNPDVVNKTFPTFWNVLETL